ncbi:MAG: hypothetical protein DMF68_21990 [Acidobacteria bacterium]|nr:MAG: hypothetical protein DMF68_21990 [Acidobacteriota bacterium]
MKTLQQSARPLIFTALTLLTACSSPSDKLTKELKTISSWAATASLVGEALMKGSVPVAYAKRTLETAEQKLQDESKMLEKSSDIPNDERTRAQVEINRIQGLVGQMRTAIEGKDQAALSQSIGQLMIEERSIKSFIKNVSGQR